MNKPLKYIQSRLQTETDINYVVKKYWKLLKLKECCNVLDVGCGPGECVYNTVLPILPKTIRKYVGIDISDKMIEYAKENYPKDPRIYFQKMDILTDSIPSNFIGTFDHIISLHCLHLISDHKKILKNMYIMAKHDGDIFIEFIGKNFVYKIYEELSQEDKWKQYLENYRKIICPTHFYEKPEIFFNELLIEAGFKPSFCVSKKKVFVYQRQLFIDLMDSVCTFNIPDNLMPDFLEGHIKIMENYNLVDTDDEEREFIHFPYTLLIAHASKV